MKNINIVLLYLELFEYSVSPDLPTVCFSSAEDYGYTSNLDQSQGSNNPGISDPSSGSGQPGNSGSNNNGDIDPIHDFQTSRRAVGSKLRDLFVNRPPRTSILMTHSDYHNRIDVWDHNVVCRSILDANSHLSKNIVLLDNDSSRYNGVVTLELLGILER